MEPICDANSLDGVGQVFSDYGFIRVRNVFSGEQMKNIIQEITTVEERAQSLPDGLVWFSPSTQGGHIIQRISRINQYSDFINHLGHQTAILKEISALALNTKKVRFADGTEGSDGAVLVIKDPLNASKHGALRWHQDSKFTKHLSINPFVNLGIYLDDSNEKTGSLVVLPRSHRLEIFDRNLEETIEPHAGEICWPASSGDVCLHSSDLWHCSRHYENPTGLRRILYFNYYPEQS